MFFSHGRRTRFRIEKESLPRNFLERFFQSTSFHSREIDTREWTHLRFWPPRDSKNRHRKNIGAIDRDDRLKTIDILNRHRVTPHHRSHRFVDVRAAC
jgi:hypothetical protein